MSLESFVWKIRSTTLRFSRPHIMGILNLTQDSFYDGGQFINPDDAFRHAKQLIDEGADMIDVGAESSRSGADPVSDEEQIKRIQPVLERLVENSNILISIDTTRSKVAETALKAGAHIINDVSGLNDDTSLARTVRDFGAGLILMHRRGTAKTMQSMTGYRHLIEEVMEELSSSMQVAQVEGVELEQIVCDPGIGFAKTAEQNFELINRLSEFGKLRRPVMIGPSRKTFIGNITGAGPESRLSGTIAACVMACERGVHILRVHDVKEIKEAVLLTNAIINSRKGLE